MPDSNLKRTGYSRRIPERLFVPVTLMGFLVSMATTNDASRAFVEPLRLAFLAFSLLLAVFLFFRSPRIPFDLLVSYLFFVVFWWVGFFWSAIYAVDVSFSLVGAVSLYAPFAGLLAFHGHQKVEKSHRDDWIYPIILFSVLVLTLTFAAGGISLRFPFAFQLSYLDRSYSQALTGLYGFSSIVVLFAATKSKAVLRWAFLFLFIVFFYFSAVGGARGDFGALLLVASLILAARLKVVGAVFLFFSVLFFGFGSFATLGDDFVLVRRFSRLFESFENERFVLFSAAISLLYNESNCLFLGCGFGFFESYTGLQTYPHNFVLELLIVHGLVFASAFLILIMRGVLVIFRKGVAPAAGYGAIFFFAIALKSGSISDSFLFLFFSGWMLAAGASAIVSPGLRGSPSLREMN